MEKPISSDLIRGHIDTIILHSIIDESKSAQQIIDFVNLKSDKKYQLNQATLYSSLKRLESLKYIRSFWHDSQDGRRKFFQITNDGKTFVEDNLTSWAFSRSIIDKLIGYESSSRPLFPFSPTTIKNQTETTQTNSTTSKSEILPLNNENTVLNNENLDISDKKEVNYRNILNGLIACKEPINIENNNSIEQNKDCQNSSKQEEIKGFNETIKISDFSSEISKNDSVIDYTDLLLKADKEGYKLRVSSKDSTKKLGTLYINKLRFYAILPIFIIFFAEFLTITLKYNNDVSIIVKSIFGTIALVPLIIFSLFYALKRKKTICREITKDGIVLSIIISINLFLLTVATNFILDLDIASNNVKISYLIMPCLTYINVIFYFIIEKILSKFKIFYVNKI